MEASGGCGRSGRGREGSEHPWPWNEESAQEAWQEAWAWKHEMRRGLMNGLRRCGRGEIPPAAILYTQGVGEARPIS